MTPTPTSPEPAGDASSSQRGISRRSIVVAGAWSVPAITVAVAAPSASASTTLAIVVTDPPTQTTACSATVTPIRFTVTENGAPAAGRAVTVTLPDGARFRSGVTGTYISGSDGVVTVPAGDIIAGPSTGAITAVLPGANVQTALPVRTTGALRYGSNSANIAAASNAGFVHLSASDNGAVAVKANGEVWRTTSDAREWVKVGDGGSTEANQSGYVAFGNGESGDALWIKDGALRYGSNAANIAAASNSGFVRLSASDNGAVAVKANGEVWRTTSEERPWVKVGDGASTDANQSGYVNYGAGAPGNALWIQGGALRYGSNSANIPAANNSGFVRVSASDNGAVAVKANGEVWRTTSEEFAWVKVGDGASTDANQSGYVNYGAGAPGNALWIQTTTTCAV